MKIALIIAVWALLGFLLYVFTAEPSRRNPTIRRMTLAVAGPAVWMFFAYFVGKAFIELILGKTKRMFQ